LKNASLFYKSIQKPRPLIYFGGASVAAKAVAAKEADIYMLWAETLELTKERINEVKALAAQENREFSGFSISFQVITGDTEEQAWQHANDLLSKSDPSVFVNKEQLTFRDESDGNKRLHQLMQNSRENGFRIGPNLWAGLTQVLGGNSIALVGTPDQVADRILEYAELGFTKFLLRGYPYLESTELIGRDVIPRVRQKLAERGELRSSLAV
jgi:alkanesulfonate monooxygenase